MVIFFSKEIFLVVYCWIYINWYVSKKIGIIIKGINLGLDIFFRNLVVKRCCGVGSKGCVVILRRRDFWKVDEILVVV